MSCATRRSVTRIHPCATTRPRSLPHPPSGLRAVSVCDYEIRTDRLVRNPARGVELPADVRARRASLPHPWRGCPSRPGDGSPQYGTGADLGRVGRAIQTTTTGRWCPHMPVTCGNVRAYPRQSPLIGHLSNPDIQKQLICLTRHLGSSGAGAESVASEARFCRCGCAREVARPRRFVDRAHYDRW